MCVSVPPQTHHNMTTSQHTKHSTPMNRVRRHLEAQRNYQAKLAAIRTALDAWLSKAQANYRWVCLSAGVCWCVFVSCWGSWSTGRICVVSEGARAYRQRWTHGTGVSTMGVTGSVWVSGTIVGRSLVGAGCLRLNTSHTVCPTHHTTSIIPHNTGVQAGASHPGVAVATSKSQQQQRQRQQQRRRQQMGLTQQRLLTAMHHH